MRAIAAKTANCYIQQMLNKVSISIDHLHVRRGENDVLADFALELPQGRVIGLVGPSGCGKTTLIRCIAGVQKITSGTVTVLDSPAGSAENRRRVGYVTQASSVYPDLSVQENLDYFAAICDTDATEIEASVSTVGLTRNRSQLVGNLSGGQRARVSLAAALVASPDLFLLDEPTVGLDPVLRRDLWQTFADLAAEDRTLLVSSHVMDEAARCDQVLLLRDGRLLAQEEPSAVLRRTATDDLETAFLSLAEAA